MRSAAVERTGGAGGGRGLRGHGLRRRRALRRRGPGARRRGGAWSWAPAAWDAPSSRAAASWGAASWGAAAWVCAAVLPGLLGAGCEGCGASSRVADTRLEVRCEVVSEPVRFWGRTDADQPSVGVLGEHALVVVMSWIWDEGVMRGTHPFYYQWFDRELRPVGERRFLGRGRPPAAHTLRFVREGDALVTWTSMIPEDVPPPPAEQSLVVLRFRPGEEVEREPFTLPLTSARPRCAVEETCNWSPLGFHNGATYDSGATPIVGSGSGWVGAIGAIASECDTTLTNAQRLLLFSASGRTRWLIAQDAGPCDSFTPAGQLATHSAGPLVALGEDRIGVLFRVGAPNDRESISPRVHYAEVSASTLETVVEPRVVGRDGTFYAVDDGYHPDAVAVGGGAVLFSERTADGEDRCDELRRIGADGTWGRTPWQLPCEGERMTRYTRESELVGLSGGRAAMVWGERTGYGRTESFTKRLTTTTPWEEGIYVVGVTSDGLRASERVRVTPPEATAVDFGSVARTERTGPQVRDFYLSAASEGEDVAVVWHDRRLDAPGLYVRRLRCTPLGADDAGADDAGAGDAGAAEGR